ncbi:MAG: FtsH protease activity modulator HflK [Deltaproteobacteria bacterium]|nr:FtsH protease activity modulator HflK [Deltaproteobacteria bacterium]
MSNGQFDQGTPKMDINLPKVQPNVVRLIIVVVLVMMVARSTFYTVQPEEQAVVLRFGAFEPDRVKGPGLHFKMPLGIDEVILVPVQRQLKQEFGFRSTGQSRDQRTEYKTIEDEANMLTGDLNAAEVEWVVQYRIQDPERYLFRVNNVEDTFADLSEAVMREVVGDRTVNEVITVGRSQVADLMHQKLQRLVDLYDMGLVVDQVVLQNVNPPSRVKPSFDEVNRSEQDKETTINQAQEERNKLVPKASGTALAMVEEAEGYALDRVNRSKGDAARFLALYAEYRKAPEVTRTRFYLETMDEILPKVGKKLVLDDEAGGVLPLLNLDGVTNKPGGGS